MSEKSEKHVVAAFKRALEGLGGCFERLCGEVAELERGRAGHEERVGVLEQGHADLKKRLFAVEQELVALSDRVNALELRLGSVATEKAAESTLKKLNDLEA